jgi:hypothetical protein
MPSNGVTLGGSMAAGERLVDGYCWLARAKHTRYLHNQKPNYDHHYRASKRDDLQPASETR